MIPKTPLMKALVGKQKNLPQQLKQAILDTPAKKADKKFTEEKVDVGDKIKTTTKDIGKGRTLTTEKRTVKKTVSPKGRDTMTASERKSADTMARRKGSGRLGTETTKTVSQKGVKGNTKTSTALAGTAKDKSGRTKYRTVGGEKVVMEGTVSTIKPRGVDTGKKKSKGKSPAKSYGTKKAAMKSYSKSPAKMKGVKALNKKK
jgi:hypothetical protein